MMDCVGGGWEEWCNGKLGVDCIRRGFHFPQYFLFFTLFAKSWVCIQTARRRAFCTFLSYFVYLLHEHEIYQVMRKRVTRG